LNTRDEEVVIEMPQIKWEQYNPEGLDLENPTSYVGAINPVEGKWKLNREGRVLASLRLDHLNSEERGVIESTCKDYQDIFYLEGDELSCTEAVKHSITVEPGTLPINTRPY
jgi:hypothetical protein